MLAVAQQDRIDIFTECDAEEHFIRIVQTNCSGEEQVIVVTRSLIHAFMSAMDMALKDF